MPAIRKPSEDAGDTRRSRRADKPKTPKAVPTDTQIVETITGLYTTVGTVAITVGQLRGDQGLAGTGAAMIERAPALTQEWIDLAKTNPAVKRALERIAGGAGLGGIVVLHAAVMAPFLASRGVIPEPVAQVALFATQDGGFDLAAMFQQRPGAAPDGTANGTPGEVPVT